MPLKTAPPAARDSPARSPGLMCTATGAACTRRLAKTPRDRQTARPTAVFLIFVLRDAQNLPIFPVSPFHRMAASRPLGNSLLLIRAFGATECTAQRSIIYSDIFIAMITG